MIVAIEWLPSSGKSFVYEWMKEILTAELKEYMKLKACDTRGINKTKKEGKRVPTPTLLTANWEFYESAWIKSKSTWLFPVSIQARVGEDVLDNIYHEVVMSLIETRHNPNKSLRERLDTFYSARNIENKTASIEVIPNTEETITIVDVNSNFFDTRYTKRSPDLIIDIRVSAEDLYSFQYGKGGTNRKQKLANINSEIELRNKKRTPKLYQLWAAIPFNNKKKTVHSTKELKALMESLVQFMCGSINEIEYDCE